MAETHPTSPGGGSPERHAPGVAQVERGKPGTFDPSSGEVHGSGSGAGGGGNPREDHDHDPMAGAGHEPTGAARADREAAGQPVEPDRGARP